MNCSVYVYGNFESGYSQYPNDYAKSIFDSFIKKATSETQVIIHRDNSLMYYGYVRKLNSGKFFGLCFLLNGAMFTDISALFSIFEQEFTEIVASGEILRLGDDASIIPNISLLSDKKSEIERISDDLRDRISFLEHKTRNLPPVSYEIATNEAKSFFVDDSNDDIEKASVKYGYTYVYKTNGFNTKSLSSYKGVITRLNNENTMLKSDNDALLADNAKLKRQKKNFTLVIWLLVLIVISSIFAANVISNQNSEISAKIETIKKQEKKIDTLANSIDMHNAPIKKLRVQVNKANASIDSLRGVTAKQSQEINTKESEIRNLQSKNSALTSDVARYKSFESKYNAAVKERDEARHERDQARNSVALPVTVKEIQIGNVYSSGNMETSFGEQIKARNSMYIYANITFLRIKYVDTSLSFKVFRGNSVVKDGTFSISSSTTAQTVNLGGGSSKGSWSQGSYNVCIYSGDTCIGQYGFFLQ